MPRSLSLPTVLGLALAACAAASAAPPPPPVAVTAPDAAPPPVPPSPSDSPDRCNTGGSVLRWDDGEGYTIQLANAGRQFALQLPGKTYRLDDKAPPHLRALFVDDVYYQFLFVPISEFHSGLIRPDDETLLDSHAKWEFAASQKSATPLDVFAALGTQAGATSGGRPGQPFMLWRMMSSRPPAAAQFWVTTVVGDQVVVMSALFRDDPAAAERFKTAFRHYVDTFGWHPCDPRGSAGSASGPAAG